MNKYPITKKVRNQMLKLRRGLSYNEIGERFGYSGAWVRHIILKGVPTHTEKGSPKNRGAI